MEASRATRMPRDTDNIYAGFSEVCQKLTNGLTRGSKMRNSVSKGTMCKLCAVILRSEVKNFQMEASDGVPPDSINMNVLPKPLIGR